MFKFKSPKKETLELMSKVIKENDNTDYNELCINEIKNLTTKDEVKITSSGNNSIFIALSSVEGDIIVPDQGGWHGFKQIGKFLNKNILPVKTDLGLINIDYLNDLDINDNSALIFTSFAGYTAEQNIKSICKFCKNNGILSIEDASAGIGDKYQLGKHSDIIIASTGSPKMINVGYGGFIASNREEILKNTKIAQKLSKTSNIISAGIYSELKTVAKNLEDTVNATQHIKKNINNTIHTNKRGVNVIIPHSNSKSICWNLKNKLTINKKSFITNCPNYNRIKQKAVCVEIKNLDYSCLKKENLNKIIEEIKNQL